MPRCTAPQTVAHRAKPAREAHAHRFVGEQIEQSLAQILRRGVGLNDFRDHELTGQNVRQAVIRQIPLPLQQPVARRRHLVGNDHRFSEQCRLERRCSRRDEHDVGSGHRILRMSKQHGQRQVCGVVAVKSGLERFTRLARCQRDQKQCVRQTHMYCFCSLDKQVSHVFKLALAAARQQCKNRRRCRQPELLACCRAARDLVQHIGERVPDKRDVDTCFAIKRCFEWKQRQHLAHRALDLAQTLFAPHPDRRTHVVHRRNAACLEAQLEIEIEIRRIDADEHSGRAGNKATAQLAANADDLEKMLKHLDIPAHREFLERKPYFHAGSFHARPADAGEIKLRHQLAQCAYQLAAEQIARRFSGNHANGAPA